MSKQLCKQFVTQSLELAGVRFLVRELSPSQAQIH